VERARDFLLDKFLHLPASDADARSHQGGIDCRLYFRAYLRLLARFEAAYLPANPLEEEAKAAFVLQRFVMRHFRLALLEARRRSNPLRSRYAWHVNGRVVQLWMPAYLSGVERRNWLRENTRPVDLRGPDAARQIQQRIDQQLGRPRTLPLHTASAMPTPWYAQAQTAGLDCGDRVSSLAESVADRKVAEIEQLRPAVQGLGPSKLRVLVIEIFRQLDEGHYEEGKTARLFGLSKATFSRFAGSRWNKTGRMPDLWANTAAVLAHHPSFIEAARATHVGQRIREAGESRNGRVRGRRA
jgi:hypothetical protein